MESYRNDTRWPFAEGGEPTLALFSIIFAGFLALRYARPSIFTRLLAFAGALLWLLVLYFFRDPDRETAEQTGLVLSAADGEVVEIAREYENEYLQRDMIRISTFLSVFDVHVQRVPVSGTVQTVRHRPGQFLQAFRPEASTANEHIAMVLETEYGPVLVKQIAGILARRCVNYANPGDVVHTGQRFGMIRFGSRVDLFVEPDSDVFVDVGDKVTGGITRVAQLVERS